MIHDESPSEELNFDCLKLQIKNTSLKGGRVIVHDTLPKKVNQWLKRDAKRRGYSLFLMGGRYHMSIFTVEDDEHLQKEYKERSEAEQDRYNHPG